MRNLILFTSIIPLIISLNNEMIVDSTSTNNITDDNFFRKEIHDTAMEAAKEFGLNPDSTYIPYREEMKKINKEEQ
jgi:hypothetical protein